MKSLRKLNIQLTAILGAFFMLPVIAQAQFCNIVVAGTASASASTICGSGVATLSLSGGTSDVGTTYHWQSSSDGATWTNIPGETNATYNTGTLTDTTFFRSLVGCAFSGSSDSSTAAEVVVNPLPAAITGAATVCLGAMTTLADATTDGTWSSSNSSVATVGSTGDVSGAAAGTAVISYTLGTGCFAVQTETVNPLPAFINGSPSLCLGVISMYADDSTGGAWSSSNPGVATITSTGNVTPLGTGTSNITYTLPTTCYIVSAVTVNPLPMVFNVTGGGAYCYGGAGTNVGLDNTETGIRYELYNGTSSTGIIAVGAGTALDYGSMTDAGVYTVSAKNINTGCVRNMAGSATITIVPLVTPSVSFTVGINDTVCSGIVSAFTAVAVHGGTGPSYEWRVNGSIVPTTVSTYFYTPADGDVVRVRLTSSEMCATPDSAVYAHPVTVFESQMPFVSITADPGNLVCEGVEVNLSSTTFFSGTAPVFTWYKNGTVIPGATSDSYSYIPTDGDVINNTLHSNFRCPISNDVASNNIGLGVYPNFLPIVMISASEGFNITPLQVDTLKAIITSGAGPGPIYQWVKNSSVIPGATNSSYYGTFQDKDSMTCVVMAGGYCGRPTFNSVLMHVSTVSVHSLAINTGDITLYPNPNNGSFNLVGSLNSGISQAATMEIYDMVGRIIYKKEISVTGGAINENISINDHLASGMYMLNLRTATDKYMFNFAIQQ
jgi:hypothetical protein